MEIFDSSLMAAGGWLPNYVFMCMITLSDKDGFLRHDPRTLYRKLGLQEDDRVSYNEFIDAIEFLAKPDEFSNLPAQDGRRIIAIQEMDEVEGNRGWFVVNKVHYRDKGSREDRANQSTERSRRWREKHKKNNDGTQGDASGRKGRHTDTDTDTDTDIPSPSEKAEKTVDDSVIWDAGVRLIGTKSSRSLIGKWVSEFGKATVAEAIARAVIAKPVEPKGYITAVLQDRPRNKSNLQQNLQTIQEWVNEPE